MLNLNKLTKKEILALYNYKCNHGHNGIAHYNCYLKEEKVPERVGFLDIETSNLKANFGIILSYCILDGDTNNIFSSVVTKRDLRASRLDKRVVQNCIKDMKKFDRVVGHYSTKFDLPFIRTRALYWNLEFPGYKEINHTDTYYLAKRLLCLHSNRQGCVAEAISRTNIKTRIDPGHWIGALQGNKENLDYILHHNKCDVKQLRGNYRKLIKYSVLRNVSI